MENKLILVTGGAGYIGSHAVKMLLEKGCRVLVIDNLCTGWKQAIETLQKTYGGDKLIFEQLDLRDLATLRQAIKKYPIRGVMHFAAIVLVNESMERPEDYFENNNLGTINLLRVMVEEKINNLVFSSTAAVYGENQYLPIDEKHPTVPTNVYGETKLISEKIIKWIGITRNLRWLVFRYFNVSGSASDGLIGDSKKPSQLLMQNAVRGAMGIEEFKLTCPKVDTPDGTPIRDYINVEDLVRAHFLALEYLEKGGKNDTINLGTGTGNSVLEIVNTVKQVTGKSFEIGSTVPRKGESARMYADIQKANEVLGWKPEKSIQDGVNSLVKWYSSRPNGWDY